MALRVWGLPYGLPYFVHPDEGIVVPLAIRFLTGDLNPHFFNWPSLYLYAVGAVFAAYGVARQTLDGVPALSAFVREPETFYLLARGLAATVGTATVVLTYAAGARLYGPAAGLAASLFLALNLQHVVDSHFATTDVPVTALATAAFLLTLRYHERGRSRDAFWTGLLGGLAAATKYNGAAVGAAFVVAYALRQQATGRPWFAALRSPVPAVYLGGAVLGFLVGTPFAALAPREFARGLLGEVRAISTVQFGNEGDLPGLLFHLLHSLPQAMGIPLLAAAVLGLGVALVRRRPTDLLLVAFPLPYLAIIGTWASRFERYAVPLLPFLSVLAALGLATLLDRLPPRIAPARRALVGTVSAVLLVSPVAARVAYYEALLARPDSRELAGSWLEQHVGRGARVAVEPYALPIAGSVGRPVGLHRATSPQVNIPRALGPERPAPPRRDGIQVYPLGLADGLELPYDLDQLRASGMDYVVLSSFVYKRYLDGCAVHLTPPCRFYQQLGSRATLVLAIEPIAEDRPLWVGDIYAPASQVFARTRPGPIIKIYRIGDAR